MKFNEVRTIVRDYISNQSADVDQPIVDAVNFLSFVFPENKIDNSKTTIKNNSYIEKPNNCLKVTKVTIDGENISKTKFGNIDKAEDKETVFWYEYNNRIQLTQPMEEDGLEIKIWYKANFIVDSGGDWNETQPAGDTDASWYSIASDSDGSNLIACAYNGRVYISSDGGDTWNETQPAGNVSKRWRSVASDNDGSNLIACATTGRLYTSSDSGITWTERQPAGDTNQNWRTVASDSDGSNLIAGAEDGRLYTSSDSGITWTERQPAGDTTKQWSSVASNSDGSKLIACAYEDRIYISSDGGANWTETQPAGNNYGEWIAVASNSNSSKLIAGSTRLYTSSDFGVTWTERQPAGDVSTEWIDIASDDSGDNLVAIEHGGRIYISSDGGATWSETGAWHLNLYWNAVASNSDGSKLIAGIDNSRIFIFSNNLEINVEDDYGELIFVGAAYRYFRNVVANKVTNPTGDYADLEIDELRKVLEQWKEDYYTLIDRFKLNKDTRTRQ